MPKKNENLLISNLSLQKPIASTEILEAQFISTIMSIVISMSYLYEQRSGQNLCSNS